MKLIKFLWGWVTWHVRAGFWYLGLAFRLWFAVGLDRDYNHAGNEDPTKDFQCPIPRSYRTYLQA